MSPNMAPTMTAFGVNSAILDLVSDVRLVIGDGADLGHGCPSVDCGVRSQSEERSQQTIESSLAPGAGASTSAAKLFAARVMLVRAHPIPLA